MNVSLIQSAAALDANMRWQEMISSNMASSSSPGFQKQEISFSTIQAGLMGVQPGSNVSQSNQILLPKASSSINFTPGQTFYTGVNTNLAITGPGFFQVQDDNGNSFYTRNGDFKLSTQGELITQNGYQVMGENGPIQVDMRNNAPISISSTGEVRQGSEIKGKVAVVEFNNLQLLTPVSDSYFAANNSAIQVNPSTSSTVNSGCVEKSNSSQSSEMANLVLSMRNFEVNQKVMQLSDERASRAISELGNPTS
jgi:flagellar basal-body rod protein FlgG